MSAVFVFVPSVLSLTQNFFFQNDIKNKKKTISHYWSNMGNSWQNRQKVHAAEEVS